MNDVNFIRCFIAAELPESVKDYLASLEEQFGHAPGANWVPRQNLHITLAFLDDVERGSLEEIIGKTDEAARGFAAFDAELGCAEAVPERMPRLLWVSVKDEKHLRGMHNRLKAVLGLRTQKFGAHITLARMKKLRAAEEIREKAKELKIALIKFRVERISVMESRLAPEGPIYSAIKTIMLKSA